MVIGGSILGCLVLSACIYACRARIHPLLKISLKFFIILLGIVFLALVLCLVILATAIQISCMLSVGCMLILMVGLKYLLKAVRYIWDRVSTYSSIVFQTCFCRKKIPSIPIVPTPPVTDRSLISSDSSFSLIIPDEEESVDPLE